MKKVLMVGAFDIIHPGHIQAIKEAKKLGDYLILILARDQNILKLKGHLPYYNEKARLKNLKNLKIANKAILGNLEDKLKVIREEKPNVIAMGYDQEPPAELIVGIKKLGVKIIRLTSFRSEIFKTSKLRNVFQDSIAGFFYVNKPGDWTSHDVVNKLRRITGIKKIGHAGTLDPFATGVLICGIGRATKILEGFHILPKTYEAEIMLGVMSNTYDKTGKITSTKFQTPINYQITKFKIQNILNSFIGKQKQLPPMFSAKKVQGKKLYELAREGKVVERKMGDVEIYEIMLLSTKYQTSNNKKISMAKLPNDLEPITYDQLPIIKIMVKCSTGTYIRTLAHDFGQKLGSGAVLWELKRTAIGPFTIKQSIDLKKIGKDWKEKVIKPEKVLNLINESLR